MWAWGPLRFYNHTILGEFLLVGTPNSVSQIQSKSINSAVKKLCLPSLTWVKIWASLMFSVRLIQHPARVCVCMWVSICMRRFYTHSHQIIPLLCILAKPNNMLCRASCNLCTAVLDDPTALKHHGLLHHVCLRYLPVLLPSLAMLLCRRLAQKQVCLHMLTYCLCYLQCCCTQTARAEFKHINHSRCLLLCYKDTQFPLYLIMHRLL